MPKCECEGEEKFSPSVLEIQNKDCPTLFHKVLVPASMGDEETNPPQNGQYRNTLLVYEATGSAFLFSSDGIYTFLAERGEPGPAGPPGKDGKDGVDGFSPDATVTQTQTGATITITDKDGTTTATVYNGKDVERIIFYANSAETGVTRHLYKDNAFATAATAQDLLNATVAGAPSVRFISSSDPNNYNEAFIQNAFVNPDNQDFEFVFMDDRSTFNYSATALTDVIFSYYKSDFQAKLTAGSNIQINGATISATDTTYSDFTGATSSVAGSAGLVPAPTTSDPDKFLKGDGTWASPAGSTSVVRFFVDELSPDGIRQMYKDISETQVLTAQEFEDALYDADTIVEIYELDGDYIYQATFSVTNIARLETSYGYYEIEPASSNTFSIHFYANFVDFVGTDGVHNGANGLVPRPTTSDAGKFLSANGTWATVSSGASRYDASWLMSQQVATQTQYDELRAAIAAGDIIYAGASNEILIATYYGAPVGSAFAYFSYDEIYSNNGNTSTTVVAMAFNVDGTTLAITPLGDTTTIPKSVPTKTSELTNDSGFITSSSLPGDMTGATSGTAGAHGLVPAPAAGDEGKFLSGAGTWMTVTSGGSYSAGNGISIDANNEISIDTSVVAEVGDIPTKTSELTNNGSDNTSVYVEADELATVATSGSYNDLLNTPTIPAAQVNADWNANSGVAEILNKPTIPAAQIQSDWTQADNTKLDYIKNKPTIPTVNDATLTITQNGTPAGTFSANSATNTTINLSSSPTTTFYCSDIEESTWDNHLYSDSGMTTQITRQEFLDACEGGTVIIKSTNTMPPYEDWYYAVLSYIHLKSSGGTTTGVVASISNYLGITGKITGSGTMTSTAFSYTSYTGGIIVTQSAGNSTSLVMSQKAVTDLAGTLGTLTGTGAPTSSTAASVGQFYMDTQTGNTYVCTDNTGGTYTWDTVGGGVSLTMTTTDPGEGSALAANTILGVYDGGGVTMDYSTSEQATGYTWIDGSMIYKKTISVSVPASEGTSTVDVTSLYIDSVIKFEGFMKSSSTGNMRPLPMVGATIADCVRVDVQGFNTLRVIVPSGGVWTGFDVAYVTLYYTKSA